MTFSWRVCIFSCSILTADTLWALNQEHLVNDRVRFLVPTLGYAQLPLIPALETSDSSGLLRHLHRHVYTHIHIHS